MTTETSCYTHPDRSAPYLCAVCHKTLCDDCVRSRTDGALMCADCLATAPESIEPLEPAPVESVLTPTAVPYGQRSAYIPPGTSILGKCKLHPQADAMARCNNCSALLCPTCDFAFPGGIHLCPACATNPKQGLTPQRRKKFKSALTMGIIAFVCLILVEASSAFATQPQDFLALRVVCGLTALICSIAGLVQGLASFDRRTGNPGYLWIGPILSGLVLAERLLVIVINAMHH